MDHGEGQVLIVVAAEGRWTTASVRQLARAARDFPGRVWLAAARGYAAQDLKRIARLDALGRAAGAPMVATNDVLYHAPRAPPAAGRADLHPREVHHRDGGPAAARPTPSGT